MHSLNEARGLSRCVVLIDESIFTSEVVMRCDYSKMRHNVQIERSIKEVKPVYQAAAISYKYIVEGFKSSWLIRHWPNAERSARLGLPKRHELCCVRRQYEYS